MRVYVDNAKVIDAWFDQTPTTYWVDNAMTAGSHTLKVELYDDDRRRDARVTVQDVATLPPGLDRAVLLQSEPDGLAGVHPERRRTDQLRLGRWSHRAARSPSTTSARDGRARSTFNEGVYQFSTTSDDGSRVYVDGQLVVNAWQDQNLVTTTVNKQMTAGDHTGRGGVLRRRWRRGDAVQLPVPPGPRRLRDGHGRIRAEPADGVRVRAGRPHLHRAEGRRRADRARTARCCPTPFYTVSPVNKFGDRGLLGIALDPNFASNHYVYLSYTYDVESGEQHRSQDEPGDPRDGERRRRRVGEQARAAGERRRDGGIADVRHHGERASGRTGPGRRRRRTGSRWATQSHSRQPVPGAPGDPGRRLHREQRVIEHDVQGESGSTSLTTRGRRARRSTRRTATACRRTKTATASAR